MPAGLLYQQGIFKIKHRIQRLGLTHTTGTENPPVSMQSLRTEKRRGTLQSQNETRRKKCKECKCRVNNNRREKEQRLEKGSKCERGRWFVIIWRELDVEGTRAPMWKVKMPPH